MSKFIDDPFVQQTLEIRNGKVVEIAAPQEAVPAEPTPAEPTPVIEVSIQAPSVTNDVPQEVETSVEEKKSLSYYAREHVELKKRIAELNAEVKKLEPILKARVKEEGVQDENGAYVYQKDGYRVCLYSTPKTELDYDAIELALGKPVKGNPEFSTTKMSELLRVTEKKVIAQA